MSKAAPTSKHTLQILMYYVMGLHSVHSYFKEIAYLGFFNPRLNTVYMCAVSAISEETIKEIENTVICYNAPAQDAFELPKNISNSKLAAAPAEVYYPVSAICSVTGQKKSAVYADIRSGALRVSKKGNKYMIAECDFERYVDYIKARQRLTTITSVIVCVVALILMFVFLRYLY